MRITRPLVQDAALVLLAIIARLAAQAALGTLDHSEPWGPDAIAASVARGDGFRIDHNGTTFLALSAPLCPLALLYVVVGTGAFAALRLNLALGGALAPVVRHIARRRLGERTAVLAGCVAAFHPPLLAFAGKVHGLNADVLLVALSVLAILRLGERPTWRHGLEFGLIGGADALRRPIVLPLLVLGPSSPSRARDRGAVLRSAAVFALVAARRVSDAVSASRLARTGPVTAGGPSRRAGRRSRASVLRHPSKYGRDYR